MKLIFMLFLLFPCVISLAQTSKQVEKQLKKVADIDDVDRFIEEHQEWDIELLDFKSDDLSLNKKLREMETGQILSLKEGEETFIYKLFEVDSKKNILTFIKVRCED